MENCTVLRRYEGREFGIVLRYHDKGYLGNKHYEEYVTHEFRLDSPDDTYWGHYFSSLEHADIDFDERVKKLDKYEGRHPYDEQA